MTYIVQQNGNFAAVSSVSVIAVPFLSIPAGRCTLNDRRLKRDAAGYARAPGYTSAPAPFADAAEALIPWMGNDLEYQRVVDSNKPYTGSLMIFLKGM